MNNQEDNKEKIENVNQLLSEMNLPKLDGLQKNIIQSNTLAVKDLKPLTKDTLMRNAFIRVSAVNEIKSDNEELGLHAGDVLTYTEEDIDKIITDWCKRKSDITYYYIKHDVDENNIHFHIIFEFGKKNSVKFSKLKKMFPVGLIERCKNGVRPCVQYLIHMNHPDKYQYNAMNINTNSPAKLEAYLRATSYTIDTKTRWVIREIIAGRIKEYQISEIDSEVYVRNASKIRNAFEYRRKLILNSPTRDINILVIQGPPRVGKSLFCKAYAEKHNKSICFSSASNDAWSEYGGQDIYVYDDFDYSKISISDFIKELDFHNNTSVKSRYHNRVFMGDTIFICTNTPIIDWFKEDKEELREALFKRIKRVIDFQDYKLKMRSVEDITNRTYKEYMEDVQLNRDNSDKGISRYTVNIVAKLSDVESKIEQEVISYRFKTNAGRFLLCSEINDYIYTRPKYHYFDMNKYVDLMADEKKIDDLVEQLTEL